MSEQNLKQTAHPTSYGPYRKLTPAAFDAVRWTQGFGADRFQLCQETILPITLVPYYAWANRGIGKMSVWLPLY